MSLLPRPRLSVTPLEDRATPASMTTGVFAVGVDQGQTGDVVVYSADRTELFRIATPYGADFTGGVRVAVADVTGDGVDDLITAPGPGIEPVVKVYDGATHEVVASFDAYEADFTGGVSVAAADLNGDGKAEVITGADQDGGPRVRVFDVAAATDGEPKVLDDFLAIDDANFRGGVRLATGDLNGDGVADLVVGAGRGGGPRVAAFDGAQLGEGDQVKLFADLFAFEPGLRNGCTVGVGDVNGDGTGDLVFGGGPGGAPRVRVADGARLLARGGGGSLDDMTGIEIANYFAGDPTSREGVRVSTTTTADGTTQVVALDVASGSLGTFSTDGTETGSLDTGSGAVGFFACSVDLGAPTGGGVRPGTSTEAATHLAVVASRGAFAGAEVRITVVALDANNRRVVDYTGTVHFTSTDAGATLPADYTFTAGDRGIHEFTATPSATGTQTITAADTADVTLTGTVDLSVTEAPVATHFLVLARPRAFAGVATQVEVIALDASNRVVRNYTGTVRLTSTDAGATLPEDYTFTADDRGVHVFSLTPSATGTQTVTATDAASDAVVGTVDLTVTDAPAATRLALLARPFAAAGRATRVTPVALDADGRPVPNYSGTVHFTSTDAAATLPEDYTFTAADHGLHTFAVALATAGSQTITATDGGSLTATATVRVVTI